MKATVIMLLMVVVLCSPRPSTGKRTAKDWGKVCPAATSFCYYLAEENTFVWIHGCMDTAMDTAVVLVRKILNKIPLGYLVLPLQCLVSPFGTPFLEVQQSVSACSTNAEAQVCCLSLLLSTCCVVLHQQTSSQSSSGSTRKTKHALLVAHAPRPSVVGVAQTSGEL